MLLTLALAVQPALATEVGRAKRVGVGIDLGVPLGLTGKFFFNEKQGLALHVGAWADQRLSLQVQFEFEFYEIKDWGWARFPIYGVVGIEPGYAYNYPYKNAYIGVFGGAGVDLQLHDAPVSIFAEVGVGLGLAGTGIGPAVVPIVHGQLGARYYF